MSSPAISDVWSDGGRLSEEVSVAASEGLCVRSPQAVLLWCAAEQRVVLPLGSLRSVLARCSSSHPGMVGVS